MINIVVEYRTLTAKIYLKYSEIQSICVCFSSSPMAIVMYLPTTIYKREVLKLESRLKANQFWLTDGTVNPYIIIIYLFIYLFPDSYIVIKLNSRPDKITIDNFERVSNLFSAPASCVFIHKGHALYLQYT